MASRVGLCGALAVVLACGPSAGGEGSEGSSSSSSTDASTGATASDSASTGSTTTSGSSGGEDCTATPSEVTELQACGLPEPCDPVFMYGEFESCVGPLELDEAPYEPAESCVLQALADGQPALIQVSGNCVDAVIDESYFLTGDGFVFVTRLSGGPCFGCGCNDWSESWSTIQRCQLADAGAFTDCMAAPDAETRIHCMDANNWVTDCTDTTTVACPS